MAEGTSEPASGSVTLDRIAKIAAVVLLILAGIGWYQASQRGSALEATRKQLADTEQKLTETGQQLADTGKKLTDTEQRRVYNFGVGVVSDWTPGSRVEGQHPTFPGPLTEGENVEVDPPRRLVQTFTALWSDEVKAEGPSRVTWEIEPVGDSCRLTVTHDELRDGANAELYGGWPMILSGLKTFLETGESLTTPGSLRYGAAG